MASPQIWMPPSVEPDQNPSNVDFLLRLIHHLSDVQQHVLGRVATHTWRFNGELPFFPPNEHQTQAAWSLTLPTLRLLQAPIKQRYPSFTLTSRGAISVRRLFHIVDAARDEAEEEEFSKMRYFVRNRPEINDED